MYGTGPADLPAQPSIIIPLLADPMLAESAGLRAGLCWWDPSPLLATNVLRAAPVHEMNLVGLTAMKQKLEKGVCALQSTSQLLTLL